jgi:hypothetical protein
LIVITSEARDLLFFPPANSRSLAPKPGARDDNKGGARNMKRKPKPGDLIRIIRVPEVAQDTDGLKTRSTLERCIGHIFPIMGFNNEGMIQIDVGEVLGKASYLESIWIEPDCVEPAYD